MEQEDGDVQSIPFRALNSRVKLTRQEYLQRRNTTTQNEILRLTQDPAFTQLLTQRRRSETQYQKFESILVLMLITFVFIGIFFAFVNAPTLGKISKSEVRNVIVQQSQPVIQIQPQDLTLKQSLPDVYYASMNDLYKQIAQLEQQAGKQNTAIKPSEDEVPQTQAEHKKSSQFFLSKFVESNPEYTNFDGNFCPNLNFANLFVQKKQTCPITDLNYETSSFSFDEIFEVGDFLDIVQRNVGIFSLVFIVLFVMILAFFVKKLQNKQQNETLQAESTVEFWSSQDEEQLLQIVEIFQQLQEQIQGNFKQEYFQMEEVSTLFSEMAFENDVLKDNNWKSGLDFILKKVRGFQQFIVELGQLFSQAEVQAESCRIGLQKSQESYEEYRKVMIEQLDIVNARLRQKENQNAELLQKINAIQTDSGEQEPKQTTQTTEILQESNDSQIQEMKNKLFSKEKELDELWEKHDSMSQQVQWLQQSQENLSIQFSMEQSKVQTKEMEKQKLEEQLKELQSENSQFQNNTVYLTHQKKELQDKIEKLSQQGMVGSKQMTYMLEQIFTKEVQMITQERSHTAAVIQNISDKQPEQTSHLTNHTDVLQTSIQKLSSSSEHQSVSQTDGRDVYRQRTQQITQRINEISRILSGQFSSPVNIEQQQADSSVRINQLYEEYISEVYNSQSYVPAVEVEQHFRNLKENGQFMDLSDKENTISTDQWGSSFVSGTFEQMENIVGQYTEGEERISQLVFDKASLVYHSTGVQEVVDKKIYDMEKLEASPEKLEDHTQQMAEMQEFTRKMVAEEEQMFQFLNETQKEIEEVEQWQEGLYRQYYELAQAAIAMSEQGPTAQSTYIHLSGQSLSTIESHSSAERTDAANEQNYESEVISSGESLPFREYNQSAQSSPIDRVCRVLSFSPDRRSAPQNLQQNDGTPSQSLIESDQFGSDHSSFAPDGDNTSFPSPTTQHFSFQRTVVQDQNQNDIFKDDDNKSSDAFGNAGAGSQE